MLCTHSRTDHMEEKFDVPDWPKLKNNFDFQFQWHWQSNLFLPFYLLLCTFVLACVLCLLVSKVVLVHSKRSVGWLATGKKCKTRKFLPIIVFLPAPQNCWLVCPGQWQFGNLPKKTLLPNLTLSGVGVLYCPQQGTSIRNRANFNHFSPYRPRQMLSDRKKQSGSFHSHIKESKE